ncbi:hypothetical protein M9H77_11737 [Catharanthus roseus]|uniref:Uncharacterized protein n=1 Tax=Catharanthus roseus TaxID=4058 RepID=A0ACC0BFI1_CATRO|nr:hypothetical protein M9H77_11737 [Catharanthus roseus]
MVVRPQNTYHQQTMFQGNWRGYNGYPNQNNLGWRNQPGIVWNDNNQRRQQPHPGFQNRSLDQNPLSSSPSLEDLISKYVNSANKVVKSMEEEFIKDDPLLIALQQDFQNKVDSEEKPTADGRLYLTVGSRSPGVGLCSLLFFVLLTSLCRPQFVELMVRIDFWPFLANLNFHGANDKVLKSSILLVQFVFLDGKRWITMGVFDKCPPEVKTMKGNKNGQKQIENGAIGKNLVTYNARHLPWTVCLALLPTAGSRASAGMVLWPFYLSSVVGWPTIGGMTLNCGVNYLKDLKEMNAKVRSKKEQQLHIPSLEVVKLKSMEPSMVDELSRAKELSQEKVKIEESVETNVEEEISNKDTCDIMNEKSIERKESIESKENERVEE